MSQLRRAKISALGTYVPPRFLTNADLEKMVDTNDKWIFERTGIRERHLVGQRRRYQRSRGGGCEEGAGGARNRSRRDLDAIIVATVTPDMFFPATACLVQHKLGAKNVWGFDLSAACSAFVVCTASWERSSSRRARTRKCWSSASDVMSSIIDYTDRATCVIFGDGAGAVLLEPAENDSVGMIDFLHEVDGSGGCSLYMPGGGSLNPSTHETVDKKMHYVHQDGAAVFKFAVRKMAEVCATSCSSATI